MVNYFNSRGNFRLHKAPFSNPLANALVVVMGILFIAGLVVVGFLAFVVIMSLFVVLAATLGVRAWWRNRSFLRGDEPPAAGPEKGEDGTTYVIEGEFHDVSASNDVDSDPNQAK